MLATKANVHFLAPVKQSDDKGLHHTGVFYYKKGTEEMKCEVTALSMSDFDPETVHEDIVQQINDCMCRTYPYDELMGIEALEPRAALLQQDTTDALARVIAASANELRKDFSTESWPQVVERCIAQFNDKVTTLDQIIAFFEPVVRIFLERGYRNGYSDAMAGSRKAFIDRVEKRITEINPFHDRSINEMKLLLEWLKR